MVQIISSDPPLKTSEQLSRRKALRRLTGAIVAGGVLVGLAECIGASQLAMLYPHITRQFGDVLNIGDKAEFPPATLDKLILNETGIFYHVLAKTFIIHLDKNTLFLLTGSLLEKQLKAEGLVRDADGSYWLALYQRCVTRGEAHLTFHDVCKSFKCPSCGTHFNCDGEFIDGPAPRSMDRFPLFFQNEQILVDTGKITQVAYPELDGTPRLLAVPTIECSV